MTLNGSNSGSSVEQTYTSPTVGYPDTSWFDCPNAWFEESIHLTFRVYDTAGTALLMGTDQTDSIQFTQLSCQAINMFTLEPLAYGSAQYDVDRDQGWRPVPTDSCRLMLLNTGSDGQLYWEHRENATAEWGGVSESGPVYTMFGIGGLYADVNVDTNPGNQFRVTTAPGANYKVVATAVMLNLTQTDKTTQININLIGQNTSAHPWVLQDVSGCNASDSNCNACPTVAPTTHEPTPPPITATPTVRPTSEKETYAPTTGPTHPTSAPTTSTPSIAPSTTPSRAPTLQDSSTIAQAVIFNQFSNTFSSQIWQSDLKTVYNVAYGITLGIANQAGVFQTGCSVTSVATPVRRGISVKLTFTALVSSASAESAIAATKRMTFGELAGNAQSVASDPSWNIQPSSLPKHGFVEASVSTTPTSSPSVDGDSLTLPIVAALVLAVVLISCLACLAAYWCYCRSKWSPEEDHRASRRRPSSFEDGEAPPTYVQSYLRGDEEVMRSQPVPITAPPSYEDEYEAAPSMSSDQSNREAGSASAVDLETNPANMPVLAAEPVTEPNSVQVEMQSLSPIALQPNQVETQIVAVSAAGAMQEQL